MECKVKGKRDSGALIECLDVEKPTGKGRSFFHTQAIPGVIGRRVRVRKKRHHQKGPQKLVSPQKAPLPGMNSTAGPGKGPLLGALFESPRKM